MDKINCGRYWNEKLSGLNIACGIRANLDELSKVLPPEAIFVAVTGRNGDYREKDDVDQLIDRLGLDVAYKHDLRGDNPNALLYGDIEIHQSLFDGLVQYVDDVYPLPESEETEVVSETKGDDRPF